MKVRYEKSMRERAKKEKLGLFTIGYVTADGNSWHLQGPANRHVIKLVDDWMEKLLPSPGRDSELRKKK